MKNMINKLMPDSLVPATQVLTNKKINLPLHRKATQNLHRILLSCDFGIVPLHEFFNQIPNGKKSNSWFNSYIYYFISLDFYQ
jgi:hypothetical protein